MSALPSFVELMASLGLENRPSAESSSPARSSTRSPSPASSSSSYRSTPSPALSHSSSKSYSAIESSIQEPDLERRPRLRIARYSPYSISNSIRRTGLSCTPIDDRERTLRSLSSSTYTPSSPRRIARRPSPLQFSRLDHGRSEAPAITPISTYVRRKTPQNSPVALTFSNRPYIEIPATISPPSLMPFALSTAPSICVSTD